MLLSRGFIKTARAISFEGGGGTFWPLWFPKPSILVFKTTKISFFEINFLKVKISPIKVFYFHSFCFS